MANPHGTPENLRPGPAPPFNSETGRAAGKKSAAAQRQKKTIRETTAAILKKPVTDPKQLATIEKAGLPLKKKPTYLEFLAATIIIRTVQKGRVDDLLKLQELLGETDDRTAAAENAETASSTLADEITAAYERRKENGDA